MKALIFTAILLLVLGAALTLFLQYDTKRFVDSLGPPPTAEVSSQDVTTLEPITIESNNLLPPPSRWEAFQPPLKELESPARADVTAETPTQSDAPPHEDAGEIRDPMKSVSEPPPAENSKPSLTEDTDSSEDVGESQRMSSRRNRKEGAGTGGASTASPTSA